MFSGYFGKGDCISSSLSSSVSSISSFRRLDNLVGCIDLRSSMVADFLIFIDFLVGDGMGGVVSSLTIFVMVLVGKRDGNKKEIFLPRLKEMDRVNNSISPLMVY